MKKIALVFFMLQLSLVASAQWNASSSTSRYALGIWNMTSDGYYHKQSNIELSTVTQQLEYIGFDKKNKNLYGKANNAIIMITVMGDYAKALKNRTDIPQLKPDEAARVVKVNINELDEKYEGLNAKIRQHREDSIAQVIEKRRQDSLAVVAKLAKEKADREAYVQNHNWHWVPCEGKSSASTSFYCTMCEKNLSQDTVFTIGIKNDSIYFCTSEEGAVDVRTVVAHAAKIPSSLKENDAFKYHLELFRDSLCREDTDYALLCSYLNYDSAEKYMKQVKKEAPYGYFDGWGWDDDYNNLSFHFNYCNTNKKTIKYIQVFFCVTNDVDDVLKTGSFRGTGPLVEWETAEWSWDYSSYYVSDDASHMSITKVILTYKDGTQKVLTKNQLVFN